MNDAEPAIPMAKIGLPTNVGHVEGVKDQHPCRPGEFVRALVGRGGDGEATGALGRGFQQGRARGAIEEMHALQVKHQFHLLPAAAVLT